MRFCMLDEFMEFRDNRKVRKNAEHYLKEWVGLDCSPNPPSIWRISPKRFLYMKMVG